jgi:uncharacterized membrane protein
MGDNRDMSIQRHLRNKFLAGIFAAIPVAATAAVLYYVESTTRSVLGVKTPFLALALAVLAIYLLGVVVTSLAGRWLLNRADQLLSRIPGLRELYQAWKQVVINRGGSEGIFARVALISDETGTMQMIGFTSGEAIPGDPGTICIFIPAAPNPTSGRLYLVPLSRCRILDVPTEEAFKMILSGGNYIPEGVGRMTSGARVMVQA